MDKNFKDAFERTRTAGIIAAGALDEVKKIINHVVHQPITLFVTVYLLKKF